MLKINSSFYTGAAFRVEMPGGLIPIGHLEKVSPYQTNQRLSNTRLKIANRLITNGEFCEFIEADGYKKP